MLSMENQRVKFLNGDYFDVEVHFSSKYEHHIEFAVYPISKWEGRNNTSGYSYFNKHDSDTHDEFSEKESRMLFNGSYRWRGVWDSRVYFPDREEYNGSEFMDMARIFKQWISPYCREWLKKQQPQYEMNDFEHGIDDHSINNQGEDR